MSGSFTAKLLFFFLSILHTLERSYYAYSIFKEWEVVFHCIQGKISIKIMTFFYTKDLSILPLLFIQLSMSIWTYKYSFNTLVYNPILHLIFCLAFAIDSSCSWLLYFFDAFPWFFLSDFFTSCQYKIFQAHLVYFLPESYNHQFL